jgi:hypothetical protein
VGREKKNSGECREVWERKVLGRKPKVEAARETGRWTNCLFGKPENVDMWQWVG